MKTIYLCGGILGLSNDDCNTWREQAMKALLPATYCDDRHFNFLDPMDRDYRGREAESVNQIVVLDKIDIRDSDIILVNASRPSWGTAMEVLYAYDQNKVIISFTDGSKRSPWLSYHSTIVHDTLEQCVDTIQELYIA